MNYGSKKNNKTDKLNIYNYDIKFLQKLLTK